ncbi:MAG: transcription antitermination factor NusB [Kineosporiaceae bacterium]|nr:transcription antitermination factor NusB [Kineosporiaceae bacterium]MBK8076587.1 transcription antitermination factor NusB [Kineosporiaceae bacterium]
MSARGKARKRALDVLFEADVRGTSVASLTAERSAATAPAGYTAQIVEGVLARSARIDELLSTYAVGWTLDRMPAVDRAILRIGAWELLYNDEVPDAVAIDEAVRLATELSTDDSPSFVNGLLARLLDVKAGA